MQQQALGPAHPQLSSLLGIAQRPAERLQQKTESARRCKCACRDWRQRSRRQRAGGRCGLSALASPIASHLSQGLEHVVHARQGGVGSNGGWLGSREGGCSIRVVSLLCARAARHYTGERGAVCRRQAQSPQRSGQFTRHLSAWRAARQARVVGNDRRFNWGLPALHMHAKLQSSLAGRRAWRARAADRVCLHRLRGVDLHSNEFNVICSTHWHKGYTSQAAQHAGKAPGGSQGKGEGSEVRWRPGGRPRRAGVAARQAGSGGGGGCRQLGPMGPPSGPGEGVGERE